MNENQILGLHHGVSQRDLDRVNNKIIQLENLIRKHEVTKAMEDAKSNPNFKGKTGQMCVFQTTTGKIIGVGLKVK